jgi:hypothetical protein
MWKKSGWSIIRTLAPETFWELRPLGHAIAVDKSPSHQQTGAEPMVGKPPGSHLRTDDALLGPRPKYPLVNH